MKKPFHIIVGMSGGVDSSVSALLLKEQGYQVTGLFMKNWNEADSQHCTAAADLMDAQLVCDTIGIELKTVSFAQEYWDRVFEYFLAEYSAGRTPNPDILCNKEIKFKAFLDYAKTLGADAIATGHYVRRKDVDGKTQLLKGLDNTKDQSYFLYALNQQQISAALFPVGELEKTEVREIAKRAKLRVFRKKDSTGICFIGERKFKDFLQQYLPAQPGKVIDENHNVMGEHQGLMYYTIGQRQGIGIGGKKDADESPWYVAEKHLESNELLIIQGHDHPLLLKEKLTATQLTWISGHPPGKDFTCRAKIRYRQQDQACHVVIENDTAMVTFDEPQRAITPGQSIVFYDGEICLGGGVIC